MGIFDLPTVPDVPTGSTEKGSIFSLPTGEVSSKTSGAVAKAVSSLKTPAVNIPEGFDTTKTEQYSPTQDEITQKYGTSTTISQAPKEGFWSKVGDFFNGAANAIFGETPRNTLQRQSARNAIVQSKTDEMNNQPYLQIAKQLGIDQVVKPAIPQGLDESKITPNVLQYYKEQAAANAVRNNWDTIMKTYPDLKLPEKVTAEQVDKALGVDPSSPLGKTETVVGILGTAALAAGSGGIGEILEALTVDGLKAATPSIINLGKNIALFTALDKATTPLIQKIEQSGNVGDGGKALLFLAQQAGNILATHGASKGVDKVVDFFAKHSIEGFQLPQQVNLSGADVQKIMGVKGGLSETEFNKMADDLGWNEDQKNAVKNGATITIPSKQIITTADRPWWGKVKGFFGFEPSSETTITKTGGGIEASAGEIEGGAAPKEGELMSLAKQITVPKVETGGEFKTGEISKIAMRLQTKTKVTSIEQSITPSISGEKVASDVKKMGTDKGVSDYLLKTIQKENYTLEKIPIKELLKNDLDLQEYIENSGGEIRRFKGESNSMPPVVTSKGEVWDGYNRIAQAIKDGKTEIQIYKGIDTNGKPIENTRHGNNSGGTIGSEQNSSGGGSDFRTRMASMAHGSDSEVSQGAFSNYDTNQSNDTSGSEEGQGKKLRAEKSISINEETPTVLKQFGFSNEFTTKLKDVHEKGGVKNIQINTVVNNHEGAIAAYDIKTGTLHINQSSINDPSVVDGSVINHEISGHSWYSKLSDSERKAFYENLKKNRGVIKEAWESSDDADHIAYWQQTIEQIKAKIATNSSWEIADEMASFTGLMFNPTMSLDSFIDRSLNLDIIIEAVNKEMIRRGLAPIDLKAENTLAIMEHGAMIAENASSLPANDDSLITRYIADIQDGTLKFGEDSVKSLAYPGETDLTLKTLEKLKGRTTVSKQFISDLTNAPDIKQTEKEILREVLKTEGDKVNVQEFADKVTAELLPLTINDDLGGPMGGYRYESVTLPETVRGNVSDYTEKVYESPIKTSAGEIHFAENTDSYFGHSRIEDMADGTTRRVIEVQSDLFQKGNLDKENSHWSLLQGNENYNQLVERLGQSEVDKLMKDRNQEVAKLGQYTNPTAHFRMVREEIKQAAKDGKTALQFPTGETAMKIEGLGQNGELWTIARNLPNGRMNPDSRLLIQDLKVGQNITQGLGGNKWIITDVLGDGKFKAVPKRIQEKLDKAKSSLKGTAEQELERAKETFDISGKVDTNNPIYRFYEKDLGRYLKNNYSAKPVTDAQGVTWYEVPIKPEMASEPVTAFREKTKDIEQLRRMLDRETQSLNAAISNPEAHAMAYGENRVPIYQERIKDLKARIAEAKNPTFDSGNTLEDARASLNAALKRTGVKPMEPPTMKVDGQDVPVPIDLFEKEMNLAFKEESIKENPLNSLSKYANKKEGTLPEVTGKGKSKFAREGDDIVAREEFKQFADNNGNIPTETIREKFSNFVEQKRQFRTELEELKIERREFINKSRIELAEKAESERKAKRLGFDIPEYDEKSSLASIPELIAAEDAIRVHPGRAFMKYVNNRTGILPEIDKEFPGVYGKEMTALLQKKGFTMEEAQKAVDNYITHVDQLFLMTEDTFNPIEMVNSPSVTETNAFQTEKNRLENNPDAKPLQTIVEQSDKYPLAKKAGAFDFIFSPEPALIKMGLGDEYNLLDKKYNDYQKELPKNIQKITDWAKRVPNKDSAQKIFNYLNGTPGPGGFIEPDFLTTEEKKVGDEIKDWLKEWATRLHLKPHERLDNYITHIFEEDLIKKEFDQDLAKIIQDKVPGEIYDPFLQQRLGALGYVQDVFRALDAYVKRATRKVHMDVALHKVKVAAADLDVDSFNHVKQYVDRINLRPTKVDNYIDNSIKQLLGLKVFGGNAYRLGARPTARITRAGRQLVYRGTLGLNIGSALKNVGQGMNTFAELGPKYTLKGYMELLKGLNQSELEEENIFGQDIIQDRTLSSTKKFWEKFDKTIFYAFETAEKINRGAAYFGAKAKYYDENTRLDKKTGVRLWQSDASEQKARTYARKIVKKTQFTFGSIDTPLALGSDIMKTVAQFQSFNLKQAEFLLEMAKNKNYSGLLRYLLAGIVIMITLGKLFKMKWQDLIPFSRYGLPPLISAPLALTQAALGTPDQFGNTPSGATRLKNAMYALLPFVPGGVQGSKTVKGLQSTQAGASVGTKIRSAIFGPVDTADSNKIMVSITKSSAAARTSLNALDSALVDTGQSTWDQVKKLGVGTDQADALVSGLSDDEYTAYKYAKAADGAYWVDQAKTVAPIVDQAAKSGFGSQESDSLVSDLTDDQYSSYKQIKNALYGKEVQPSKWDQQTFIQHVANLAQGWGTDPITAFDDLIHGDWKIDELKNGQIIVDRMPVTASEAIKKAAAKNNANYKLDHIIPLEVGGNNSKENLQIISTENWANNTDTENALGKALANGRITGKQAREYAIRFKAGAGEALSPELIKEYKEKYGSKPMTYEDVQNAIK